MNTNTVFDLIAADGPYPEFADKLMLYGQFVGAWDLEAEWFDRQGGHRSAKGEWHFAWVLGGRGIQDVLFAKGSPVDHYGTSLRCYDPVADIWHISWMQPSGGEFVHLIGRQEEDRIVQQSVDPISPRIDRWCFSEIKADSFTWTGEVSLDAGKTWFLEQKMMAARVKGYR